MAFNRGIVRALEDALDTEITVPRHHEVMGAIGAALLAHESMAGGDGGSRFRGFGISETEYETSSFLCRECPTLCEVTQVTADNGVAASWGGQCDRWEASLTKQGAY